MDFIELVNKQFLFILQYFRTMMNGMMKMKMM